MPRERWRTDIPMKQILARFRENFDITERLDVIRHEAFLKQLGILEDVHKKARKPWFYALGKARRLEASTVSGLSPLSEASNSDATTMEDAERMGQS